MSTHTLLIVITSFGLLLGGCEKNNANEADTAGQAGAEASVQGDQPPREPGPMVEQPGTQPGTQPGMQPGMQPGTQPGMQPGMQPETTPGAVGQRDDVDVWPAVTIMSVNVDCPQADVHFETGLAELDATDKSDLDSLATCLQGTAKKEDVRITATTDPRGSERYNEDLSRQRAQAVADYLQQKGVKADNFQIRARGEQGMIEDVPMLWPLQREATVEPQPPGSGAAPENQRNDRPQGSAQ